MRKLGLLALVLGLVVAFAMPVSAITIDGGKGETVYIGGTWLLDFGAFNRSKERMGSTNGSAERTQLVLGIPPTALFKTLVTAGQSKGYMEFGFGSSYANDSVGTQVATNNVGGNNLNYVEIRKFYGSYTVGNCELRVGKDSDWLYSGIVPAQSFGLGATGIINGFGFGSFYDGRLNQVAFLQTVNKQFNYRLSLVSPREIVASSTSNGLLGANETVGRAPFSQLPTLAAKAQLNFGMLNLYPAVAYSQTKWDGLNNAAGTNGWDDSVTSWFGALPAKFTAGPFTATGSVAAGLNIGNMMTNTNAFQVYQRLSTGKIKNTSAIMGFIDVAYTFGAFTPHFYYGYDKAENSDAWTSNESSNTRQMYGVTLEWVISPNFIVKPQFTVFDYGKKVATASSPEIGKDWIGGVQFMFNF